VDRPVLALIRPSAGREPDRTVVRTPTDYDADTDTDARDTETGTSGV